MRPIGDSFDTANRSVFQGTVRRRALEKLKPASGLHDSRGDFAQARDKAFDRPRPKSPSQSGTAQPVPFRYGYGAPRLNAAFVAQLLGQLLPDERCQARACAAYDEAQPSRHAFDKKL
jgi:hypothetical protein